jgi:hypothetical protein
MSSKPDGGLEGQEAPDLVRIVSGGQTGVDRAALDVAISLGIPIGGWLPRGRLTEEGPLDARYPLRETASARYADRTRLNVRDADATLILTRGRPTRGTALTLAFARQLRRPYLLIDLERPMPPATVRAWLIRQRVRTLNVAGPRESLASGIYGEALSFLARVLRPANGA